MKVAIGCDHGGINLKPTLKKYLEKKGIEYVDFGCDTTESVDYNDYAIQVANAVKDKVCDFGILICGTGIGMSIVANKVKGIRCTLVINGSDAIRAKAHINANVVAMGSEKTNIDAKYEKELDKWYGLTAGGDQYWYTRGMGQKTLDGTGKNIEIRADVKGDYEIKVDYSDPNSPKITVSIPKGEYGELVINLSTGDVNLPKEFTFKNIDIACSTGSIKTQSSAYKNIKLKVVVK